MGSPKTAVQYVLEAADWLAVHPGKWAKETYHDGNRSCVIGRAATVAEQEGAILRWAEDLGFQKPEFAFEERLNDEIDLHFDPSGTIEGINDSSATALEMRTKVNQFLTGLQAAL